MKKVYALFICLISLFSCAEDGSDLNEAIIGSWQLERIRVEGTDCQLVFGADVPAEYLANEEGCTTPTEILGNSKRCVNVEFMANGEGFFLWSEISGQQDAPITYTVDDNGLRYCFVGSACSGTYEIIGNKLESVTELRLDEDCSAVYVLRKK